MPKQTSAFETDSGLTASLFGSPEAGPTSSWPTSRADPFDLNQDFAEAEHSFANPWRPCAGTEGSLSKACSRRVVPKLQITILRSES
jgi:hypothetical protein